MMGSDEKPHRTHRPHQPYIIGLVLLSVGAILTNVAFVGYCQYGSILTNPTLLRYCQYECKAIPNPSSASQELSVLLGTMLICLICFICERQGTN